MEERRSSLVLSLKGPVAATLAPISLLDLHLIEPPGGKQAADEASEIACCRAEDDVTAHYHTPASPNVIFLNPKVLSHSSEPQF